MDGTTPTTTLTSSTPAAPAAPAISAPASVPTPSERPTFAQAFAQDAAPIAETPAAPEGTATIEPAATSAIDGALNPSEPKGPIPFDVHKTALENARTKAAEQAQQEFDSQFGWAKAVDRGAVEEAARLGQLYQTDRAGYIRQVLAEAITDPTLAPLVRSEAARVLGSRQSQPQPAQTVPDVPIVNEQGQVVGNLRDIVQAHLAEYAAKEIAPLKSDLQQRKAEADARKAHDELQTHVQDIYAEAVDLLPGFKEHEAEIAKVFATIPGDPAKAMRAAWKQVVGSTLANRDSVRTATLDELKTKAAASAVNPAQTAVTSTSRPKSFHDPSLKWS
jgi:hypothetical protein